jgi:hypothetical protein
LLAHDQDEAADIVDAFLQAHPHEQVYDELLLPALTAARQDLEREELSDDNMRFILNATGDILDDLAPEGATPPAPAEGETPPAPVPVMGYPIRDAAAEVALRMLSQLLDPTHCRLEVAPVGMLSSEIAARLEEQGPAVVCVASLAPGGLTLTRSVLKRIRARFPRQKIVALRLGPLEEPEKDRKVLLAAGADAAALTLLEARGLVTQQAKFAG